MKDELIFINGNCPSSKNSRVMNFALKLSLPSKQTQAYIKASKQDYIDNKEKFIKALKGDKPYKIGFHFVRKSRHKYDFINACQIVQDLMVKYGWLDDDNTKEMFPFPLEIDGKFDSHDKEVPGVYIKVL